MAKRLFGSSRDPFQVQISIHFRLPKGVKPTTARANAAVQFRLKHGYDHPNARTKIIRWRNPSRRGAKSHWRKGNQADAWSTIAPWLQFAHVTFVDLK